MAKVSAPPQDPLVPRAAPSDGTAYAKWLAERYKAVRTFTRDLCEPLVTEDFVVQSMADVSPTKWHLAHTTWFFETFVLTPAYHNYRPFVPEYAYLFNSYYNAAGKQFHRPQRGLLSRPTVKEIFDYRAYVDRHVAEFLENAEGSLPEEMHIVFETGLHHEQQHQELLLTDIKHVFSVNPLHPSYVDYDGPAASRAPDHEWEAHEGGLYEIGHDGEGFAYDNEGPRHKVYLEPFAIGSRLVTCGEFMEFIEDGGYERPGPWLSDGWKVVTTHEWRAPLYWERSGDWYYHTLGGFREVDPAEPVCHVSFYEAHAYASWRGCRLPREEEWEVAVGDREPRGNFVDSGAFHPVASASGDSGEASQLFGDVWEWTSSPYSPYPGYRAAEGALGEYNGKFMCNQMVLRGGSCATSRSHIRSTYRNFFPADARWQFSGIRLAEET